MTDKQIIIDGVDVSGCKFFRNGICASPINPKCKLCVEISEKMCYYKQLKRLEFKLRVTEADYEASEQECEELKRELQAQRDFTAHEQKLIYCVACDETCKTGNDCKQEKCIFKDNIKLKQTIADIKFWVREFLKRTGQVVPNEIKQILQKISEVEK